MMARGMMGMLMVMGLLLAMVPDTMQQALNNLDRAKPVVGLILSTTYDEQLLLESGSYVPIGTMKKAGRTYNIGTFNGVRVVYVIAVAPIAHVSATVQILIDSFRVAGLIDYSNAATVNPSLKLGDVAVLSETAFTSTWTWEDYKSIDNSIEASQATELPTLKIGEYNVPEAGENKLGNIKFVNGKKYTPKGLKENFWYYIDPTWLQIAEKLKDIKLESCVGEVCADEVPSIVYGIKGSTSDVYLENEAYGKFLNEKLGVSTADRKSAATVSTAVANKKKHIVFRAASNRPGVPHDSNVKVLASKNNFKVVSEFVKLLYAQYQLSIMPEYY